MRAMLIVLWLGSTASFNGQLPPDFDIGNWALEFIQASNGQYSRLIGYKTKKECEAAIPSSALAAWWQGKYNPRCIEVDHKTGGFIGSHDPALSKK